MQYHPEVAHTPHGQDVIERFLHEPPGCGSTWTMDNFVDASVAAIRDQVGERPGHLRAVRRRRLGGRRRAGAPGDRPTAHLRVRRHRPDAQGRGRPGRRDVPAPPGHRAHPRPRRRPVLRTPGRRHRPGGEAQGDRRAVHPRLRGRVGRRSRTPSSSCRARCTPTSSSPAPPTPRRSRATTTSAASPRTWTSSWSSRCAPCSRTRSAQVGSRARPARRDRLAPAVPRPRPRRAHHRRGHARQGRDPPGGRRDRPRGAAHRRPRARDLAGVRRAARHPHGRA